MERHADAARILDDVVEAAPGLIDALMVRGLAARGLGNMDTAETFFTRVIAIDPTSASARLNRAMTYAAQGRVEDAAEDLRSARRVWETAANPVNRMVFAREFGDAWRTIGEMDRAMQLYRTAVDTGEKNDLDYRNAWRRVIDVLIARKQWAVARQEIEKAIARHEDEVWFYRAYADVLKAQEQVEQELAVLQKALELEPKDVLTVQRYLASLMYYERYEDVLKVAAPYVGKEGYDIWLDATRATAMAKLGRTREAETLLLDAFKKSSKPIQYDAVIQNLWLAFGSQEAESKLTEWLTYRPNTPEVYKHLGGLRQSVGDHDGALEAFRKAAELFTRPEDKAEALNLAAGSLDAKGQYKQAEAEYLRALRQNPKHLAALNNLAYLYVDRLNRANDALPHVEKALAIRPNDGHILDTYGWVLARMNRVDEALPQLELAQRYAPGTVDIYYHLGWVYEKKDRLEDARDQYRKARELVDKEHPLADPISEGLQRVQGRIDSRETS